MLNKAFHELDHRLIQFNQEASVNGTPQLQSTDIHIIGQMALIEAKLSIAIVSTVDIDLYYQIDYRVKKEFSAVLEKLGKHIDPVGHEAWMPDETEFNEVYQGELITGWAAKPVYVILSKAKKAPEKNHQLIAEYIASADFDESLFDLADKYEVDLSEFV